LEDDNSSDDDKKSKKKALASIAINNKPSIFDTSTCLMAKPTKVKMMIVMLMLMKVIVVRMKQLNKLIKMI
jgi:hypothetical protein